MKKADLDRVQKQLEGVGFSRLVVREIDGETGSFLEATIDGQPATEVEVADIKRVNMLFSDLRRSTEYLVEHNKEFMFNEYTAAVAEG